LAPVGFQSSLRELISASAEQQMKAGKADPHQNSGEGSDKNDRSTDAKIGKMAVRGRIEAAR
jgi:hypothetical protein